MFNDVFGKCWGMDKTRFQFYDIVNLFLAQIPSTTNPPSKPRKNETPFRFLFTLRLGYTIDHRCHWTNF